jgi:hypothetical protein
MENNLAPIPPAASSGGRGPNRWRDALLWAVFAFIVFLVISGKTDVVALVPVLSGLVSASK